MDNTYENAVALAEQTSVNAVTSSSLDLDPSRYMAELEGFSMSEQQKVELLETLWSIMHSMVDLGFDVGKADLCGQLFGDFNEASEDGLEGVESGHTSIRETATVSDKG